MRLTEEMTMWGSTIGCIVTLILSLLTAPFVVEAQQRGKMPIVGVLSPGPPPPARAIHYEAFLQGLRDLGYREGENVILAYRYAAWQPDRLPALAADLVRLTPDVIVTETTPAIQAAKQATTTIPIVMGASGDPIGTGFVASLARPGGNITGLTILSVELSAKRLELLTQLVPGLARVAVLWTPANPAIVREWQETQEAARRLGVQVQSLELRGPDDFARVFAAATQEHAQALYLTAEGSFAFHLPQILDFAARSRLPTSFNRREHVEAGGFMTYGVHLPDLFRRAATYVDKILKGAHPGDLPVEQPMKFAFVINLKTAKALGLTIPPIMLFRADEVIE